MIFLKKGAFLEHCKKGVVVTLMVEKRSFPKLMILARETTAKISRERRTGERIQG